MENKDWFYIIANATDKVGWMLSVGIIEASQYENFKNMLASTDPQDMQFALELIEIKHKEYVEKFVGGVRSMIDSQDPESVELGKILLEKRKKVLTWDNRVSLLK